ncbi:hypothetical protein GCM10018980_70790 [Streptomyces capoamus]|uniref:Uncharacterized protein n=1 Tax=Streptomyces capoamus TaxID=68183 RepID=A0A919KFV8_9ACTN|nr:hypothetical protein [Streptomyces capoamus]GGW13503.1 hypothetical protein GCM10010501_17330 [Streptomyces libani subsp. rufus]GHG74099.1 hypothetical protein GCM10018980_70790 [Streptomyces capoamus]
MAVFMTLTIGGAATPAVALSAPVGSAPERVHPPVVAEADAVPGIAPQDTDESAVYLDENGQVLPIENPTEADSEVAPAAACTPVSGRDNPHRSATGVAVSGHGWWGKGTCTKDLAKVYNCLYEWYTDNTWRRKACSKTETLKPGTGGSSHRTAARHNCTNTSAASWRNHVDVDVIGEGDTGERPYRQADVACQVY